MFPVFDQHHLKIRLMEEWPGVQVELGWELGITIWGQDATGLGRNMDPEIIPGVTFPQAVPALAKAISAMQPHETPVFISWERYDLLRGGDVVEALRLTGLCSCRGFIQELGRPRLGL